MKDYKKYYIINETPDQVYIALTNPVTLELWTGEEAVMSTEPNTEFSLWNGDIVGKNLEFVDGKKIVQEWYFGEQDPASIVTIILHEDKQRTSAELRHTNIPDEDYDDIVNGWNDSYFCALQAFYDI